MNIMDMFNPAMMKNLQENMAKAQEKLKQIQVTGEAGGGIVKVTLNGQCECLDVYLDPIAVDPRDVGMLQALIKSAYCAAWNKLKTELSWQSLPGLMGNMMDLFKNPS